MAFHRPDWHVRFDDAVGARGLRADFLAHLHEWGAPDADFHAAGLAFDELLANVVRHAPGPLRIDLEWSKCRPILHVSDRGPGFAIANQLPACALTEAGRGLFLVTAMVGPLSVRRLAGTWTCVSVTLPIHRKECDRSCEGHP